MKMTGTARRKAVLEKVEACVCRDRQNSYGDAEDNFQHIASYWTDWLTQRKMLAPGVRVQSYDVAAMCQFIKLARAAVNPMHLDNWVDGAGYAVCGAGIVESQTPAAYSAAPERLPGYAEALNQAVREELQRQDPRTVIPRVSDETEVQMAFIRAEASDGKSILAAAKKYESALRAAIASERDPRET